MLHDLGEVLACWGLDRIECVEEEEEIVLRRIAGVDREIGGWFMIRAGQMGCACLTGPWYETVSSI